MHPLWITCKIHFTFPVGFIPSFPYRSNPYCVPNWIKLRFCRNGTRRKETLITKRPTTTSTTDYSFNCVLYLGVGNGEQVLWVFFFMEKHRIWGVVDMRSGRVHQYRRHLFFFQFKCFIFVKKMKSSGFFPTASHLEMVRWTLCLCKLPANLIRDQNSQRKANHLYCLGIHFI